MRTGRDVSTKRLQLLPSAPPVHLRGGFAAGLDEFGIRRVRDGDKTDLVRLAVEVAPGHGLVRVLEPVAADIAWVVKTGVHIVLEALRALALVEGHGAATGEMPAVQRPEVELAHDDGLVARRS